MGQVVSRTQSNGFTLTRPDEVRTPGGLVNQKNSPTPSAATVLSHSEPYAQLVRAGFGLACYGPGKVGMVAPSG